MMDSNLLEYNNTTTNFSKVFLIPTEGYIAAAVVLFFIGFFGFFLNLAVIIFMWKEKQLWTPINIILFNLVVGDFLVSILGNPWTFVSAVNKTWMFGKTGCTLYGFIMAFLGIASITTLTVLAFERYLMIARPLGNNGLNFQRVGILILVIWIYALILTAPPLIGWGEYVNEAANISCSVNWEKRNTNSMTYIIYLFLFGLFIPLAIIVFSYTNIILKVKKNILRVGRVNKAETRVTYMILIMIIAFVTAWSPYAILALIIQFGNSSFVTPGMAVFPALLAKSSICYNPIIYIGLNAQFQNIWRTSHKRWRQGSLCDVTETSRFVTQAPLTTSQPNRQSVKVNKVYKASRVPQSNVTTV